MMQQIEISCPAWDTFKDRLIYPVSPEHREAVARWPYIEHILSDSKINDTDGRYKCTECNESLIPKRGSKRRWHFAHYSGSSCKATNDSIEISSDISKTGGESNNHKQAKFVLFELLKHKQPITIVGSKCKTSHCNTFLPGATIKHLENDTVHMEYTIPKSEFRADIAVVNNGNIRYIFEILHTSETKTDRPDPWFEITASVILDKAATARIDEYLVLKDSKAFLCGDCPQISASKIVVSGNECDRNQEQSRITSKITRHKMQIDQRPPQSLLSINPDNFEMFLRAINSGNARECEYFIRKGIDFSMYKNRIFDLAFDCNNFRLCDIMVNSGLFRDAKYEILPLLLKVIRQKDHTKCKYLMSIDVNINMNMNEPLRLALSVGCTNIILLLLRNGADYQMYKDNLIIHAHKAQNPELDDFILQNNLSLDISNKDLIINAIRNGNVEDCRCIIQMGADLNVTDSNGFGLAQIAISLGNNDMTDLLLSNGAPLLINPRPLNVTIESLDIWVLLLFTSSAVTNDQIHKLLELASENSHLRLLKALAHRNINLSYRHANGYTPLIYSIINNKVDVALFLLDHDTNPLYEIRYRGKKMNALQIARNYMRDSFDALNAKYQKITASRNIKS
jgi:ankyrin repeat protein